MIPNTKNREIETSGVAETAVFGISTNDTAHIMSILRDTLYSDKILAVLREYGANAWDAHREVGKGDLPIKVTLPSAEDPTLYIRDFGPGLSHDKVFTVFTQYGASTKRESDLMVGALGIGCKSGFAYSDSFTISSWHDGKKRAYVAVLDKSEKGVINLLDESDCGEETGVEIQIAVRAEDILEFDRKAQKLFRYFVPQPEINTDLIEGPTVESTLKHGAVSKGGYDGWMAIMGCVPYRIDLGQLKKADGTAMVVEAIRNLSGCLYFGIGDIHIAASREELRYTAVTKDALAQKFELVIDEYVTDALNNIDSEAITIWEKKIRAQVFRELHLPIPEKWKALVEEYATVKEAKTFSLIQNKSAVQRVNIQPRSRFVLEDTKKDLQGYHLTWGDYLVRPISPATLEEVEAELLGHITTLGINGIGITRLSEMNWVEPFKPNKRTKTQSKKYQVTTFRYLPDARTSPKSACWEVEQRVPKPEDVFVILDSFKPVGHSFAHEYNEDCNLSKCFNQAMPTIYGYKTTEKKPISVKDCVGTHYEAWRPKFVESLLVPKISRLLNHWQWSHAITGENSYRHQHKAGQKAYELLTDTLGEFHPITQLITRQRLGIRVMSKMKDGVRRSLEQLAERLEEDKISTEPIRAVEAVYRDYPLLALERIQLWALWGDDSTQWLNYVKLVDRALATGLVTVEE